MNSIARLTRLLFLSLSLAFCSSTAFPANEIIAFLGDSNTWLGGEACDNGAGWTKWFRDCYPTSACRSFARSGATWTETDGTRPDTKEYSELITDNNVISNQLLRLEENVGKGSFPTPQIVVVFAGTNDAWFSNKRPSAKMPGDSRKTAAGIVDATCRRIHKSFPDAKILLITPPLSTKIPKAEITAISDIIEKAAAPHKGYTNVLRLDKEGFIDLAKEAKRPAMLKDGVHTSIAGARKTGCIVADFLTAWLK